MRDGFQLVSYFAGNVVSHFRGAYASVHMAVEETGEQRDLLSESNSEGQGSVRWRFVDTEPVYVDDRGALFHRA